MQMILDILQFIGLVSCVRWIDKQVQRRRKPAPGINYTVVTYTEYDQDHVKEICSMCHKKLEKETDPQKN